MFKRLSVIFSLIAVVIILAMMNFTTPTSVGPLGVLVFFTTVYVFAYGISLLIVDFFLKLLGKGNTRKDKYYAAVVAFSPIMLLLLQSFGSLSIITVLGVGLFVFLACFVIQKRL